MPITHLTDRQQNDPGEYYDVPDPTRPLPGPPPRYDATYIARKFINGGPVTVSTIVDGKTVSLKVDVSSVDVSHDPLDPFALSSISMNLQSSGPPIIEPASAQDPFGRLTVQEMADGLRRMGKDTGSKIDLVDEPRVIYPYGPPMHPIDLSLWKMAAAVAFVALAAYASQVMV